MKPLRQLLGLNLSLKHINEVANVNVCTQFLMMPKYKETRLLQETFKQRLLQD